MDDALRIRRNVASSNGEEVFGMDFVDSTLDEMEKYWTATGALFYAFSKVECLLSAIAKVHLLRSLSAGVPDSLERSYALSHAIIGGNRFAATRDLLKRIMKAEKVSADLQTYVNAMFQQLGEIQKLRDRLAHQYTWRASKQSTEYWINHDFPNLRDAADEKPIVVSLATLWAAVADCAEINHCLDGSFMEHRVNRASQHFPVDLTLPTWRYKPSLLIHGRQNIQNFLRGLKLPPQSSA